MAAKKIVTVNLLEIIIGFVPEYHSKANITIKKVA